MYVNCTCHRLDLNFKHTADQFSWLAKLPKLLLGLWKSIHYSALNHLMLIKIKKAYGMKSLHFMLSQVGYHMVQHLRDV